MRAHGGGSVLAAVVMVAGAMLAACSSSSGAATTSTPPASTSPSSAPVTAPAEATFLASRTETGGMCPDGGCLASFAVSSDGTWNLVSSTANRSGALPANVLAALTTAATTTSPGRICSAATCIIQLSPGCSSTVTAVPETCTPVWMGRM